ncbi:putative transporter C3H1,06c OS=Schizosaccharomyces pombe (strain 972 / ATCC 24843) GN=SPAC3H1.06c PE=3 SV=1 [Rhizoctonia solani AG-1 IB]|uniref:Putative transporter C3H1,06c n=1 Tax=Thanatephorus cucumeris (strain AG1-IB / isolate 7/3/14) TaxID=1108050 RepID=A0A0B7FKR5_THACB|nr:putative transporter C3H1,06c OS=Schizosaccharomyces pombe (strain 972 / ATCC 24843) GN=SPAC3H1.06c PE=3 SV=1 [Rhizoctonia solani AG-1 IB]
MRQPSFSDPSISVHQDDGTQTPKNSPNSITIEDQSSRLPFKKLVVVFLSLFVCLFVSFLDQTSVSTVLPAIAHDLGAADRINWVGISFLVATTSSQIVIARLSDIFGRKLVLISVIVLFAVGNLLSGFAQTAIWLFIARAISGIGGGGINSLCMIITSDVVSLEERGKYQGFLGAAVALGSGIGPLIGGALSTAGWRWVFWFTVPISITCIVQLWWLLPQNELSGNFLEKLRKVDFVGSLLSLAAVVLILVPISGGGTYYSWHSALVIAMLCVGSVLAIAFLLVEWRMAALPILPLHLFRVKNILIIYTTTILTGIIYYCNLYFLPSYYTDARGFTPIQAGVYLLPLILIQTLSSSLCGQILVRTRNPKPVIVAGFSIWCIGAGLQSTFGTETSRAKICGYLILQGIGVGGTLQTTLVAAQASVGKEYRAVVTGARNFFRTLGGAIGLVVCTTAKNAELKKGLRKISGLASELIPEIIKYGPEATTGMSTGGAVRAAYTDALHTIFVIFIPIAGLSAVLSVFLTPVYLPGDKDVTPTLKASHSANVQEIPLEPLSNQGHTPGHVSKAEDVEKQVKIPGQ